MMDVAGFVKWCIENGCWNGCDIDGADAQEKAVMFGIIERVDYDPLIHGGGNCDANPGDEWYVYTGAFKDLAKSTNGG